MRFVLKVAAVLLVLAALEYYPMVLGKIPLPVDKLNQFSVFRTTTGARQIKTVGPDNGDLAVHMYQWHVYAANSVRQGQWPFWNPHLLSGFPFMADGQSAVFYPPNILYFLLPVPAAWSIIVLLQVFLAGVFTALYVRSIGASDGASIFAAIAFSFCGFMAGWRAFPIADTALWLPLVLWCIEKLRADSSVRRVAFLALTMAMPVVAGHPETVAHIYSLAGFYSLFRAPASGRIRFLGGAAIAVALAIGMSAVHLVPTWQWSRLVTLGQEQVWPARPPHEALALFSRDMMDSPNSAQMAIPEAATYVGMITLLLAVWSALHSDRKLVILWVSVTAVAFAEAYGVQPVYWLVTKIPIIGNLKNWRLVMILDFCLAVLAALGLTAAGSSDEVPRRKTAWLTLIAGTVLVLAGIFALRSFVVADMGRLRAPSGAAMFLAAGGALLALRLLNRIPPRLFVQGCVVLVAMDVFTAMHGQFFFAGPEDRYPTAPTFEFLKSKTLTGHHRVAKIRFPYADNAELAAGLYTSSGYDIPLLRSRMFLADYQLAGQTGINLEPKKVVELKDRRLDLLDVRYLVADSFDPESDVINQASKRFPLVYSEGMIRVYENKNALDRAQFIPAAGIEVIADEAAQLKRLADPSFDPARTVIVEAPLSLGRAESTRGTVATFNQSINDINVTVDVSTAGILVVSETNFPGWRVTVDGKPGEVLRVDHSLLGVALDTGSHAVAFTYLPPGIQYWSAISLICLFLAIGASGYNALSQKPKEGFA